MEIKKPQNGKSVLLKIKNADGQEFLKLGFYAEFQAIDGNANIKASDKIGEFYYLRMGWYETVFNNPKFDCVRLEDVKVLEWFDFKKNIYKAISYSEYVKLCAKHVEITQDEASNWPNHYWVLDSKKTITKKRVKDGKAIVTPECLSSRIGLIANTFLSKKLEKDMIIKFIDDPDGFEIEDFIGANLKDEYSFMNTGDLISFALSQALHPIENGEEILL